DAAPGGHHGTGIGTILQIKQLRHDGSRAPASLLPAWAFGACTSGTSISPTIRTIPRGRSLASRAGQVQGRSAAAGGYFARARQADARDQFASEVTGKAIHNVPLGGSASMAHSA